MRDRDRVLTMAMAGVGIVVGLLAGLFVGWVLWPVQYTDTELADLKPAYQDEYILMVGAAYAASGDLEQLRQWRPTVAKSDDPALRPDGNNVSLERELADLMKNTLLYNACTRLLSARIEAYRAAITGQSSPV